MSGAVELANWVELEGCFNFRDLGGYATADGRKLRTGQVFRSDGLQALTESDLRLLTGEIGLGAVIDLRSDEEVAADGSGGIAERVPVHRIPLFQSTRRQAAEVDLSRLLPDSMGDLYFMMLTVAQEPIARVVRLLSQLEVPAVFHCAAGKDRTGVISSVLLSLLGVPEETIVADYAFSRKNIDRINARLDASATYQRLMRDLPEGAYDADPAAVRHFLARVAQELGSLAAWAESAGIDAGIRSRLDARLLR